MSRSFRRVIVVVLAGGVLWSCGSERVTVSEGGQGAGEQVRRSLSKAAVDRGVTQAVVVVTVREDGMPVPGAAVEFSRSISGREAQYAWSGTTDEAGRARVALGENATGYYQARAWQDGNLLGRWSSIPINGGYEVLLDLAVGGKARVTGSSLLSSAPEDSLTREEALALVKAATSPGFEVITVGARWDGKTENSALEGEILDLRSLIPEEFTAPCLMGGTVTVNNLQAEFMGDPDSDEDVSVSLSMTMIHSDCVVTPEDTGLALTLNGAPNLAISLALSIMGDLGFALSGEVDGTVRWATDDGRSGSCRIDLDIEAEIGPSGFASTLTGQACGARFTESDAGMFSF